MAKMTPEQRKQRREQRKAEKIRHEAVMNAAADELNRFNAAIASGATPILKTFRGEYIVKVISREWDAWCAPVSNPTTRHLEFFALCNDGTFADLMQQANVERNPYWSNRNA